MREKLKSVVAWIYIMFFSVQIFSIASAFIIQNDFADGWVLRFFRFWDALGKPIFENWLSFSILFILLFAGGILSAQLKSEKTANHKLNFVLLCINLFLCNRCYNTGVLQERMRYIGENVWGVLGFLLAVVVAIGIGNALKKEREYRSGRLGKATISDVDIERGQETVENYADSQDERFREQYPVSSAWDSYKQSIAYKKRVKHREKERRYKNKAEIKTEEKKEIAQKRSGKRVESAEKQTKKEKLKKASAIVVYILILGGMFYLVVSPNTEIGKLISNIGESLNLITLGADDLKNPILNFLFGFGSIFLIAITLVLMGFAVYFVLRTLWYFIVNLREDNTFVKKIARDLKAFFFGLADSVVRLLLFLPDFLVLVEDFLFDMRDDSWILTGWKWKGSGRSMRIFWGIIWNFRMEFPPMILSREFLPWRLRDF